MALFNHLSPYGNIHDINLDWIISIIKSIDPAVIQALQKLPPDIIEQVSQKAAEAQAAAISAQSSAYDANAAKNTSVASAEKSTQEAERAENAATAISTAIETLSYDISASPRSTLSQTYMLKSGNVITLYLVGIMTAKVTGNNTTCAKIGGNPGINVNQFVNVTFWRAGKPASFGTATIGTTGNIVLRNADFETNDTFIIDTAFAILPATYNGDVTRIEDVTATEDVTDIEKETGKNGAL